MTWWSVQTLVIAGAILITIVVAVLAGRSRPTGKVELAVVPTSSFDPSMEDIVRYATHLVRTRRVRDSLSGGPRPVRVALKSVGEGQLVQTVTVDESAAAMLRRHGLAGVEMITMDELDRRLAGVTGSDSSQPDQDRPNPRAADNDAPSHNARSDAPSADGPSVQVGPGGTADVAASFDPAVVVEDLGDEPAWPAGPDATAGQLSWPSLQGDSDG